MLILSELFGSYRKETGHHQKWVPGHDTHREQLQNLHIPLLTGQLMSCQELHESDTLNTNPISESTT
jgi:hypothetical protein